MQTYTNQQQTLVDSLLHPQAIEIRQLLEQPSTARMIIDDEENIWQAIEAKVVIEQLYFTADSPPSPELLNALEGKTAVYEIARRTSKKLFKSSKFSRLFAIAQRPQSLQLAELAHLPEDIVVLENLGIAGNVGAILRTAVAFGVGAVVLLDSPLDPYDRRLIRASRGLRFALPLIKASTAELIDFCAAWKRPLLVTDMQGQTPVQAIATLPQPLAILFGNEKLGCSPSLTAAAQHQVQIPLSPLVESLNVSAAAAIVLFQRLRHHR